MAVPGIDVDEGLRKSSVAGSPIGFLIGFVAFHRPGFCGSAQLYGIARECWPIDCLEICSSSR